MTNAINNAAESLLAELAQQGIALRADGDNLLFHPKNISGELIDRIRLHKPALLRILHRPGAMSPERAAEIEARIDNFFDHCVPTPDGGGVYDPRRTSWAALQRILGKQTCTAPDKAL